MTGTVSPTATTPTPTVSVSAEDLAAVREVVKALVVAWARQDADALAQVYTEDATVVLPGDTYLKGRSAIRDAMAAAFQGKWKGTHVVGVPIELRYLGDGVCLMISQGGAHKPGAAEVSVDDAIRAIWIFVKEPSGWAVAAYENTPLGAAVPIPDELRTPTPNGRR